MKLDAEIKAAIERIHRLIDQRAIEAHAGIAKNVQSFKNSLEPSYPPWCVVTHEQFISIIELLGGWPFYEHPVFKDRK